jgi:hypothetical protein
VLGASPEYASTIFAEIKILPGVACLVFQNATMATAGRTQVKYLQVLLKDTFTPQIPHSLNGNAGKRMSVPLSPSLPLKKGGGSGRRCRPLLPGPELNRLGAENIPGQPWSIV